MELGRKIYYTRVEKGMKQKTLAKKIGVSTSVLNKWENCELNPDMKQVDLLAKGLGIPVGELLDNDIRNLLREEVEVEMDNGSTIVDLLKIVGIIIIILILLLVVFYL